KGRFASTPDQPGRDKAGWDDYDKKGTLAKYSVDDTVTRALSAFALGREAQEKLKSARKAAHIYKFDASTSTFKLYETLILKDADEPIAKIKLGILSIERDKGRFASTPDQPGRDKAGWDAYNPKGKLMEYSVDREEHLLVDMFKKAKAVKAVTVYRAVGENRFKENRTMVVPDDDIPLAEIYGRWEGRGDRELEIVIYQDDIGKTGYLYRTTRDDLRKGNFGTPLFVIEKDMALSTITLSDGTAITLQNIKRYEYNKEKGLNNHKGKLKSETWLDMFTVSPYKVKAYSKTSDNRPSESFAYYLPEIDRLDQQKLHVIKPSSSYKFNYQDMGNNLSRYDFMYFYIDTPGIDVKLEISDGKNSVTVNMEKEGDDNIAFWAPMPNNTMWFPDPYDPVKVSRVSATVPTLLKEGVRVINIPMLAKKGLDTSNITGIRLISSRDSEFKISDLNWIGERAKQPTDTISYLDSQETAVIRKGSRDEVTYSIWGSGIVDPEIWIEDRKAAVIFDREEGGKSNPLLRVFDISDNPNRPVPEGLFYTLSWPDGKFIELNKAVVDGDKVLVYGYVSGFDTPRVEIYSLDTFREIAKTVTYGKEKFVTTTPEKLKLENSVYSNFFNAIAKMLGATDLLTGEIKQEDYLIMHGTDFAKELNALKGLAEMRTIRHRLPWKEGGKEEASSVTGLNREDVVSKLLKLRESNHNRLIPDSPGTVSELFVNTEKEADILTFLLERGKVEEVREIFAFYVQASNRGTRSLASSYNSKTSEPGEYDSLRPRPSIAKVTSGAQIAMSRVALQLFAKTGNNEYLETGYKLLARALEFRPKNIDGKDVLGGFSDAKPSTRIGMHGWVLWPIENYYSTATNAKALLLLKEVMDSEMPMPDDFRDTIQTAYNKLETWMKKYIMPRVKSANVVPRGANELYDLYNAEVSIAAELQTSADSWLWFIEYAKKTGLFNDDDLKALIDKFVEVYGVKIDGKWGLDFSAVFNRREGDVISSEITAHFMRVANMLGYEQAARFSRNALNTYSLSDDGLLQEAYTENEGKTRAMWEQWSKAGDTQVRGMETGQGFRIMLRADGKAWPASPHATVSLMNAMDNKSPYDLDKSSIKLSDIDIKILEQETEWWHPDNWDKSVISFVSIALGLNFILLGWTLASSWLYKRYKRRIKDIVDTMKISRLYDKGLINKANARWAKKFLGRKTIGSANAKIFVSNSPIEGDFIFSLHAIQALIMAWREAEGVTDLLGDDPWLNGMDEFIATVAIYMRKVIKDGFKEGEGEDSNHIWARLELFIKDYRELLREALAKYKADRTEKNRKTIVNLLNELGISERTEAFDMPDAAPVLELIEINDHIALLESKDPKKAENKSRAFNNVKDVIKLITGVEPTSIEEAITALKSINPEFKGEFKSQMTKHLRIRKDTIDTFTKRYSDF
ncbi:hypothetical protein KJ590_04475, partial [Patescibacteria group bacterium]|nr:hypothetical protein [Patescibacteria group bacterium]